MTHQISIRATRCGRLAYFDMPAAGRCSHVLEIPPGMCPKTRNPLSGQIRFTYESSRVLEVVSLHQLVRSKPEASTFEGWVWELARSAAEVVGPVEVHAVAQVAPGPQSLEVSLCCSI